MRITKKMLQAQNEVLKTIIFVLLGIVFVLGFVMSAQMLRAETILNKSISNTDKIIDILTLEEKEKINLVDF